jgi:hypothetical protein
MQEQTEHHSTSATQSSSCAASLISSLPVMQAASQQMQARYCQGVGWGHGEWHFMRRRAGPQAPRQASPGVQPASQRSAPTQRPACWGAHDMLAAIVATKRPPVLLTCAQIMVPMMQLSHWVFCSCISSWQEGGREGGRPPGGTESSGSGEARRGTTRKRRASTARALQCTGRAGQECGAGRLAVRGGHLNQVAR